MTKGEENIALLLEKFKNEIKSDLEETLRSHLEKLNIQELFNEQKKKYDQIMEENCKLKDMILKQNRQIEELRRKNNIVIFGVSERKEENFQKLEDNILDLGNSTLGVEINKTDLNYVRRIGPSREKKRPIVVSFVSYNTKRRVLQNCYKLKGTSIFITDDLDKEQQSRRKELIQIRANLKQRGINDIKMKNNGLIIEGKFQHFTQLTQQPSLHVAAEDDEEEEEEESRDQDARTSEQNLRTSKKRKKDVKSPIQPFQKNTIMNFFRPSSYKEADD